MPSIIGCSIYGRHSYTLAIIGSMISGAGLAAGFPVMLGLLGNQFASLSGTAFGIALTMALFGNMVTNYIMGFISQAFGIQQFTTVLYVLMAAMFIYLLKIF